MVLYIAFSSLIHAVISHGNASFGPMGLMEKFCMVIASTFYFFALQAGKGDIPMSVAFKKDMLTVVHANSWRPSSLVPCEDQGNGFFCYFK